MIELNRRDLLRAGVCFAVLMRINPVYAQIGLAPGFWAPPLLLLGKVRLNQQYVEWITTGANNLVRLDQQYVEWITTGTNNLVRLDQQYVEWITMGANNLVRLDQQYVEIITDYGPY